MPVTRPLIYLRVGQRPGPVEAIRKHFIIRMRSTLHSQHECCVCEHVF
jgi:hypothetical protein